MITKKNILSLYLVTLLLMLVSVSHGQVTVYNNFGPGNYSIDVDVGSLPTGIYIYKLQSGGRIVAIRKMSCQEQADDVDHFKTT